MLFSTLVSIEEKRHTVRSDVIFLCSIPYRDHLCVLQSKNQSHSLTYSFARKKPITERWQSQSIGFLQGTLVCSQSHRAIPPWEGNNHCEHGPGKPDSLGLQWQAVSTEHSVGKWPQLYKLTLCKNAQRDTGRDLSHQKTR